MNALQTLGEAGVPHDDASYGGETGDSAMSLQYIRNKVTEFQRTMQGLDEGYRAALAALSVPGLDAGAAADLQSLVDEYESKRWLLRTTAETINLGAAAFNASGGRLPSLSIPSTLGFLPVVVGLPMIAAVGTAAGLIIWGSQWLSGVNERLKFAQALAAQTSPEAAAALAASVTMAETAERTSSGFGLASLGPILKWGALALGAWMVWKMVADHRARNPVLEMDDPEDSEFSDAEDPED